MANLFRPFSFLAPKYFQMIFWLLVYLLTLVPETQRGHILIYLRFYRIHDIHVYYNLIWWKLSVLCCVVCVCLFLFCPMFFPVSLCCLFSVAPLVFASFYSQISTSTDIQRKHKLLKWYTFYFWTLGWLSTCTYLFFSNLQGQPFCNNNKTNTCAIKIRPNGLQ